MKFVAMLSFLALTGFTSCGIVKKQLEGAVYCEDPPDRFQGAPPITCQANPASEGGVCCAYMYEGPAGALCYHLLCSEDCGSFVHVDEQCLPDPQVVKPGSEL